MFNLILKSLGISNTTGLMNPKLLLKGGVSCTEGISVHKLNSPAGQVKCNNVPKTFRKPQDAGQLAKGNCAAEWTRVSGPTDRILLRVLCLGWAKCVFNEYLLTLTNFGFSALVYFYFWLTGD